MEMEEETEGRGERWRGRKRAGEGRRGSRTDWVYWG